jgi:hypothetical protein
MLVISFWAGAVKMSGEFCGSLWTGKDWRLASNDWRFRKSWEVRQRRVKKIEAGIAEETVEEIQDCLNRDWCSSFHESLSRWILAALNLARRCQIEGEIVLKLLEINPEDFRGILSRTGVVHDIASFQQLPSFPPNLTSIISALIQTLKGSTVDTNTKLKALDKQPKLVKLIDSTLEKRLKVFWGVIGEVVLSVVYF